MKYILPLLLLASPLSAAVVYSGSMDLQIPVAGDEGLEGVYVNIATGATAVVWPDDFDESPWINLTVGGYGIFNSEVVQPRGVKGGTDYDPEQQSDHYLNLSAGTILGPSGGFLESAWGSQYHMGTSGDPGKFVPGESGFIGFAFQYAPGGETHYGWLRFTPENGVGTLIDWAYNDEAGESIAVGAIPEPSAALLSFVAAGAIAMRRRLRA